MLILEYTTTDASRARRIAADCGADAEAYARDDGLGSLVLCAGEVAGKEAPAAQRRVDVLFTGGRYAGRGGDWLFHVGLWTPAEFRDEFVAWYRLEHLPILLECPLWDGCRFVEQKVDAGCQFFALHQLAEKSALDSVERRRSRSTPWFTRLSANDWFDGAFRRTLCRRLPA
jgi:hypothetical protein